MFRTVVAMALFAASTAQASETQWPMVIPAPNGAVVLPSAVDKEGYDEYRYAAVRRVDNMLYLSGVVMGPREKEATDVAAFKAQVRRGFERIKASLEASGASLADVVMVNSFHVWDSPSFSGTRDQHWDAFYEVVADYVKAPYPAWTAVGTNGLLAKRGVVEVQVIARLPK
ncbi:Rid family hydrolase [Steroidobacter cummioxidans]|uniref:Rid family hydrolase n=1 Tax=Steroidobacter cummioxidans TaxID=1803913 RepID=UPI0019D4BA79|nr:Rid family hydrolase [Steroidobacter cummioxidans]